MTRSRTPWLWWTSQSQERTGLAMCPGPAGRRPVGASASRTALSPGALREESTRAQSMVPALRQALRPSVHHPCTPGVGRPRGLEVEVHLELVRVRAQGDRGDLLGALV